MQLINERRSHSLRSLIEKSSHDDKFLCVTIIDSGIGMTYNNMGQLFSLFGKVKFSNEKVS